VTDKLINAKVWDGSGWVNAGVPWWGLPFANVDTSGNVTVTCDVNAHTKGAWTEIIASTTSNVDVLRLRTLVGVNALDTSALLDIGIGAAGSETAMVENLAVGGAGFGWGFSLPVAVPQGTRIAARAQSVITEGRTLSLALKLFDSGNVTRLASSVVVIGGNTATSGGVVSAANNTWTEITAATTMPFQAVILVPSVSTSTLSAGNPLNIDLGKGSAGNEVLVNRQQYQTTINEVIQGYWATELDPIVAGPFPTGTRFSARTSFNGTLINFCLIGIPYP
jgi:hypothetical protein